MTATTEPTYRRQPVARPGRPKTGRTQVNSVDVIATSVAVLRPVAVAGAIFAAAIMWGPRAHADIVGDALSDVGIGNNGPVSNMIAEVGTSLCPLLVQPGSQMASTATQMSGQGGPIAPPLAGFATQVAIQTQCPSFMTSLANGNIPALMNGGLPVTPPGVPGLSGLSGVPGLPGATPLGTPGLALPNLSGATTPTPGLFTAPALPTQGLLTAPTAPLPAVSAPSLSVPVPGAVTAPVTNPLQLAAGTVSPPGS